jgi:hypothetical protein
MNLATLEDFDTIGVDEIEASRRALGATPPEFAEHLGWSTRKYQRVLEGARDADGYVDRDVALAVRGLAHVLLGTDDEEPAGTVTDTDLTALDHKHASAFFGGRTYPQILQNRLNEAGEWTAQVTPHLLRLVADRAVRRKLITYGEAATTLEERGLTKRVWPRTLYGMPLGAICYCLMTLGRETKMRIPLLSVIVVKASGEPGPGLDPVIQDFIKQYETKERAKEKLTFLKRNRETMLQELQQEVFDFPHWPGVLHALAAER